MITLAVANACGALKYLKASELGAFGCLSATMTMVLSAVMLKERISFIFVLALALVLPGIYLMMKSGRKKQIG